MLPLLTHIALLLIAYGLGCFNTGYYLVRWRTAEDIRRVGSGTAGARNVGRILGRRGALLTFAGDALKAALAVGLARLLHAPDWVAAAAMLAVVVGHVWPIQLRGQGGKGASSAFGGVLAAQPLLALVILITVGLLSLLTRRTTLSGLLTMLAAPFLAWALAVPAIPLTAVCALVGLLLYTHRANLATLATARADTP
jgi:glycerol-3-phosphate acyltransferase PlsY